MSCTLMPVAHEIRAKLNVSTGIVYLSRLILHCYLVACKIHEADQFLIKKRRSVCEEKREMSVSCV